MLTDRQDCRVLAFKTAKFTYWAGAAWSLAGEVTTAEDWHEIVRNFQKGLKGDRRCGNGDAVCSDAASGDCVAAAQRG